VHDFDDATNSFRMLGVPYFDFLTALHTHLTPRTYLEVGTETGSSLALVGCDAIAVDPQFQLDVTATGNRRRTFFFQMPSDTFFATENVRELLGRPVDMVFLDGMHRFEFLLRDLIGTEAACHPRSLILLHDCVPLIPRMALRQWLPGGPSETDTASFWTGDVWKLLPILKKYRPACGYMCWTARRLAWSRSPASTRHRAFWPIATTTSSMSTPQPLWTKIDCGRFGRNSK